MSLFSTNRFSNLSAEIVEERYKASLESATQQLQEETEPEENTEDPEMLEIDPDIQAMFGDEDIEDTDGYFEGIEIQDGFSNLIETCIQISENNKNVYEALLELDFVSSMNESMLLEDAEEAEKNNSAKKENILKQLNSVITGVKEANKESSAKLYTEFGKIIKSDNNLDKYIKLIDKADFKDFAGISNFCFPNDSVAKAIDEIEDLSDIVKFINRANADILNAETRDDIEEIIDEFELSMDSVDDDYMESSKKATEKQNNWKPSNKDITLMKCFARGNSVKKAITTSTKDADNCIDKINKAAKKYITSIYEQEGEIQVSKMDAIYRCVSSGCRMALKKIKAFQDLEIREIAAYRRAIITCGKYAASLEKGIKESAEEQDMFNTIIGESSDMYIFERFGK